MTLFQRFCRIFRVNPWLVRMLIVFTVSGGCVLAFSEAKSENGRTSDSSETDSKKKKVVVLGTGWAAINFLKNLKNQSYDVQVISPRNYFAFTPLLPSVTCGTLEPRSIVEPIRNIVRKELEDAQKIRRTVIDCFERASLPNLSDDERKRILHFVVVGGGPTGVEFSAGLHDYVKEDLVRLYPKVKEAVKITLIEATDHILNMFDKRVTAFAEEKFQRDGIDVKTGAMVVKVSDKEISTKEVKNGGGISTMPYGMAVWATGIGTRPVITDFLKQIGQEDILAIFRKADKDKSGTLTVKKFQGVLGDIRERYPQVALYLKNKRMRTLVDLLKDSKGDAVKGSVEVNLEEFKSALSQVDSEMKNLPATAQVAAQQGSYLADCFNRMEKCERKPEGPLRFRGEGRHRFHPFRYKHLGQFAPLGGEQTAAQLPGDWVSIGHSTQWLWYSVYVSGEDEQSTGEGFRRVGADPLEYASPNFQAGKEHLLTNIKRRDRHNKTNTNVIAIRTRILRDEVDESKLEIQKLKRQHDEMELRIMAYATVVTNIENKSKRLIRNWVKTCDEIFVGKMREIETGKQNSDGEDRKKRKLDTVVEDFDGNDVHQDQEGKFDPKKSSGDYAFGKKYCWKMRKGVKVMKEEHQLRWERSRVRLLRILSI
ncbi:UNVERIFIED_CONTAM: External alternative NAD(P)H-ubiquinone oxidoreductase B2, mitochondrial [Sesamum radiatum]|uniref:NADH:ubiquinone reductase (non-electrogenic) n=1 Tax=Sesamum radiatum TaxID=300843 RepID=A0AAW2LPT9_SESRA